MRSSVVVNGVTLTAEQLEKAWEELNKPEGPKFTNERDAGKIVRGSQFGDQLIVSRSVADAFIAALGMGVGYKPKEYLWTIDLHDGQWRSWREMVETFEEVKYAHPSR